MLPAQLILRAAVPAGPGRRLAACASFHWWLSRLLPHAVHIYG
ncbi:hypothetical protein CPLU01_04422 [Colletotrichum plurivorum]|uniref:Uncharacterized protein n=1 Tax=Colletotrichum plurivorum TaxID=2175906 RepID=A0A8H6KPL1_9PEZI|nr:hypothetical protein CPLU01_04422 [Colletotrichum plurivorum]